MGERVTDALVPLKDELDADTPVEPNAELVEVPPEVDKEAFEGVLVDGACDDDWPLVPSGELIPDPEKDAFDDEMPDVTRAVLISDPTSDDELDNKVAPCSGMEESRGGGGVFERRDAKKERRLGLDAKEGERGPEGGSDDDRFSPGANGAPIEDFERSKSRVDGRTDA